MASMSATLTNVRTFLSLSDWMYTVPVYQRDYIWDLPECRQLWTDITEVMAGHRENHFIGSVVCKDTDNLIPETVIIDGQQRITTLLLIIRAFVELYPDYQVKRTYAERYLVNRNASDDGFRLKLRPVDNDKSTFAKLMKYERNVRDSLFTEKERETFIYKNYVFLRKLMSEAVESGLVDFKDIIQAIESLLIIHIKLGDENPQLIFESINSTGKPLENYDLIRNYILMRLPYDEQKELYEKYWKKIEQNSCASNSDKALLGQFLLYWIIIQRRSDSFSQNGRSGKLNKKSLYSAYKQFFDSFVDSFGSVGKTLSDILDYSEAFKAVTVHHNGSSFVEFDNICSILLEDCRSDSSILLLMWLYYGYMYKRWTYGDLVSMSRALLNYTIRARICWSGRHRGIDVQTASLTIARFEDNFVEDDSAVTVFWRTLTSFSGEHSAFVSDVEFLEGLSRSDFYTSGDARFINYVLYELNKFASDVPPVRSDLVTIEHIMPQTLSDSWYEDLEKSGLYTGSDIDELHANSVNMLGNLLLTIYNSELGNKCFLEKRNFYQDSSFVDTNAVSNMYEWNFDSIKNRTKELAKRACLVWDLPSEYVNMAVASEDKWYTFNADFDLFDGFAPSELNSFDNKDIARSWETLYVRTLRAVYLYDEDLFERAALVFAGRRVRIVSKTATEFKRSLRVSNTQYFANTVGNSKTLFNWTKEFLDVCSEIMSSDFIDSFRFKVRKK